MCISPCYCLGLQRKVVIAMITLCLVMGYVLLKLFLFLDVDIELTLLIKEVYLHLQKKTLCMLVIIMTFESVNSV